jgi:hypothetical protein
MVKLITFVAMQACSHVTEEGPDEASLQSLSRQSLSLQSRRLQDLILQGLILHP